MIQQDAHDLAVALKMVGDPRTSLENLLVDIADAGAIVSVRDAKGVMLWASASVSGGRARALGQHVQSGVTYWHPDGTLMRVEDRPVDRARLSGLPVASSIYGVQLRDEPTRRWNQVLALPLAGGAEGRSVLTIGFDITSAIRAIQLADLVALASHEEEREQRAA